MPWQTQKTTINPTKNKVVIDTNTDVNSHIYGVLDSITIDRSVLTCQQHFTLKFDVDDYNIVANRFLRGGFGKYVYVTISNTPIDKIQLPDNIEYIEDNGMKKIALMQDKEPDWFKLYTPYNKDAIEEIKSKISVNMRVAVYGDMVYQKTGKRIFECWRVHKSFMNEIVEIINKFWPGQSVDSDLTEVVGDTKTDWIEKVFDACPKDNMSKLYKALAYVYHPDVGGDSNIMSRINIEYQRRNTNGQPNAGKP